MISCKSLSLATNDICGEEKKHLYLTDESPVGVLREQFHEDSAAWQQGQVATRVWCRESMYTVSVQQGQ